MKDLLLFMNETKQKLDELRSKLVGMLEPKENRNCYLRTTVNAQVPLMINLRG